MKATWTTATAVAALLVGTIGASAQAPANQKQGGNPAAQQTQPDTGAARTPRSDQGSAASGSASDKAPATSGSAQTQGNPAGDRAGKDEQDTGILSAQDKGAGDTGRTATQRQGDQSKDKAARSSESKDKDQDTAESGDRSKQRAGEHDKDKQRTGARERDDDDNQRASGSQSRDQAQDRDSGTAGRAAAAGDARGQVQFSERERSTIRDSVDIERARVDVDFDVSVGATVPRRVDLLPLPPTIVEINPAYRSYRYVVVEDEIVIVDPQTYAVVEVIPASGGTQARTTRSRGGAVQLDMQQRQRILTYARAECQTVVAEPDFDLTVGIRIPERIELCPFEDVVVREVDVVQPYRFFIVRNQVVLVDPSNHTIVEVIR